MPSVVLHFDACSMLPQLLQPSALGLDLVAALQTMRWQTSYRSAGGHTFLHHGH